MILKESLMIQTRLQRIFSCLVAFMSSKYLYVLKAFYTKIKTAKKITNLRPLSNPLKN